MKIQLSKGTTSAAPQILDKKQKALQAAQNFIR
jgi:hypothetical protein